MSEGAVGPTVYLYSFGYHHSGPPEDESGHGGGFVFDCRALPNPFWDEALRPFTGTEAPIVSFMESRPEVLAFFGHARALVLQAALAYREQGRDRLMAAFGCTGGRHRSVFLAERLARTLEAEGVTVALRHLDMETHGEKRAAQGDDPGGGAGYAPETADR